MGTRPPADPARGTGGGGLPSSCSFLPSPPSKRPNGKKAEVACRCSGTQQTPEVLQGLRYPHLYMMPPRYSYPLGAKEKGEVEGAFTKCLLGARYVPKPVELQLAPVSGPQTRGGPTGLCPAQASATGSLSYVDRIFLETSDFCQKAAMKSTNIYPFREWMLYTHIPQYEQMNLGSGGTGVTCQLTMKYSGILATVKSLMV